MKNFCTTLPLAVAVLALVAPNAASACHEVTVCLNWEPMFLDKDFGDFTLGNTVRARGTRIRLVPPAPELPTSTFLDEEGCVKIETQFAFGHTILVYGEAWIGSPNPPIHLQTQRRVTEDGMIQDEFIWIVHLQGLGEGDVVEHTIPSEELDPIAPIMAAGTEVLERFRQLDILPTPPSDEFTIQFRDYSGGAGYGPFASHIFVGPDTYREKFVFGHEMGHWVENVIGGGIGPGPDYKYPTKDAPCKFGVNDPKDLLGNTIKPGNANTHGIRSSEYSFGAMGEGFAHFISSVVFNDFDDVGNVVDNDGVFRYYKDINVDTFTDYKDFFNPPGNSRVSLLTGNDPESFGGPDRWTNNECLQDWSENEISSELDWLRFFWHFVTRSGPSPTVRQLLELFKFVKDQNYVVDQINIFPVLQQAVGDSPVMMPFLGRFNNANTAMGVYNAAP